MRKLQYLLWFSYIFRVRAPTFSHSNSTLECYVHPIFLFRCFLSAFRGKVTPKVAPRRAPGSPKTPKGVRKVSLGRLKIVKKSTLDLTWVFKGARDPPEAPARRKIIPKSIKKRYFSNAPVREKCVPLYLTP